jgi:hypothetical protein
MATRKKKPARVEEPLPRPLRRHHWVVPFLSVLVALGHLGLVFAGVQLYYDRRVFPATQGAYLLAWEALLLAWLLVGQWRSRHFQGLRWLSLFWSIQVLWAALGFSCFAGWLGHLPLAIGAVPVWPLCGLAWAILVEHARFEPLEDPRRRAFSDSASSPYYSVLKALGQGKPRR